MPGGVRGEETCSPRGRRESYQSRPWCILYCWRDKYGKTRTSQKRCPAGSFCVDGKRNPCPAGRFGALLGEKNRVSGPCKEGYFCPEGSYDERRHSYVEAHTITARGSSKPVETSPGYFSEEAENNGVSNGERNTRQVLCTPGHYCVKGERYQCPIGRYGSSYGLYK